MRKRLLTLTVAIGLAMSLAIPVGAADLNEGQTGGVISCSTRFTVMHFVQNQYRGSGDPLTSSITVTLDIVGDGEEVIVHNFDPVTDKFNRGTIHYFVTVTTGSILLDAGSSIVAGRLVISDAKCKGGGKLVGLD